MHVLKLTLTVAAVALTAGCGVSTSSPADAPVVPADTSAAASPAGSAEPAADESTAAGGDPIKVTISKCTKGDFGATFAGTAKNTGKEVLDATISVEVLDAKGDRVDEAGTIVTAIKPGQSVKIDGVGLADVAELPKKISCRLLTVSSFPSA